MHKAVEKIAQAIRGTLFEREVWLVGGCVRDELLFGDDPADLDLVTEKSAEELGDLLYDRKVASEPPVVFKRFGTVKIVIDDVQIELVQARKESYSSDSRKPDVVPGTLIDDALRRDFTLNTLMRNITTGELHDPLGLGLSDLSAKILRTPTDPLVTMADDPLRMLRAVRFRWKLGFEYADDLVDAIQKSAHRLNVISAERIRTEWMKMLANPHASDAMRDLLSLNLLEQFCPELVALVGVEQGPYHHLDAWDHTLGVLDGVGWGDPILSLAALFHDVGKPVSQTFDESGRIRFYGHEEVGADIARVVLNRLSFSNEEISTVCLLVREHMRLGNIKKMSKKAARRLLICMGEDLDRFFTLVHADRQAHHPDAPHLPLDEIEDFVRQIQADTPAEMLTSPLDGKEIMELLSIHEGATIGQAKYWLQEQVISGKINPGDKNASTIALLKWFDEEQKR